MKKIFLTIFLSLSLFFLSAGQAKAIGTVDLSVTCTSSTCTLTPSGGALFNEAAFAPGQSVTRTISVTNDNTNDDCYLELKTKNSSDPNNLAPVLFTVIKNSTTDIFGESDGISAAKNTKKIKDIFTSGYIALGTIPKSSSKSFYWVATFDPTANDDFQGKQTTFDFDLSFTCGVPPAEVLGTSTSTLTCSEATPATPTGFNATTAGAGPGQVILSWDSLADPHTYFLIAYSDNSAWPPKWGNPNVGNGTGYTVSGLGNGTYWFWLRAGNGCQPGNYVGPISPVTISGVSGGGTAEGFTEGVLGAQDNINSGAATASSETINILGAQTSWWQKYWWILPLIIFGGLLLWWFLGKMRGNENH